MAIVDFALIGVASLVVLSLVVGLAVARMLGHVAADVTDLLDAEEWSAAPLTRALGAEGEGLEAPEPATHWH